MFKVFLWKRLLMLKEVFRVRNSDGISKFLELNIDSCLGLIKLAKTKSLSKREAQDILNSDSNYKVATNFAKPDLRLAALLL